jgi:hypothetical protein
MNRILIGTIFKYWMLHSRSFWKSF